MTIALLLEGNGTHHISALLCVISALLCALIRCFVDECIVLNVNALIMRIQVPPSQCPAIATWEEGAPKALRCVYWWSSMEGGTTLSVPCWCRQCHPPWYGSLHVLRYRQPGRQFCYFPGGKQTNYNMVLVLWTQITWMCKMFKVQGGQANMALPYVSCTSRELMEFR